MAKQTNIRRRGNSWVVNIRVNGEKVWRRSRRATRPSYSSSGSGPSGARHLPAPVKSTFRRRPRRGTSTASTRAAGGAPGKRPPSRLPQRPRRPTSLPAFGDRQLADVTAERIAAWRRDRIADGGCRAGPPEKVVAVLHGIFERARREYGLPGNPVGDVDARRNAYDGTIDFYSPEEVRALVRAADRAGRRALPHRRVHRPSPRRARRAPRARGRLRRTARSGSRASYARRRAHDTEVGQGRAVPMVARGREGARPAARRARRL